MNKAEGKVASSFKNIALILHGFDGLANIKVNGANYSLQDGSISFLSAISKFDPQGNFSSADGCKVKMTVFRNESGEMKIVM
jgi:alpha-glucosidase